MTVVEDLKKLAEVYFAEGRFETSLQKLKQLEDAVGLDAELANNQAVILYKLGHTAEALEMFRRSSSLGGDAMVAPNVIELLSDQANKLPTDTTVPSQAAAPPVAPDSPALDAFGAVAQRSFQEALAIWMNNKSSEMHNAARQASPEEWANALYASVEGEPFGDYLLPGFIDEQIQRNFVGASGVQALQEGYLFTQVVMESVRMYSTSFGPDSKAVDFGSGWGRMTRFLLKYVHPDNLYALEVDRNMVEHCRKAFGTANFLTVPSMPPCTLRDNLVDLVSGFSVFSHLSKECADAWIAEFARILRPGGVVVMTTQGRPFIDDCRRVRESGDRSTAWFVSLANSFVDNAKAHADYEAGEFLFSPDGQYGDTYGEAIISRAYIERNWLQHFELVDFVDDRNFAQQALFVLRRK